MGRTNNKWPIFTWQSFNLVAFIALTSVPSGKDALQRISEALLTASTLYLSVFILFTVSQNAEVLKDTFLFRQGLTYRFFQVDRILASLAVYLILAIILNIILEIYPRRS